MSSVWSQRARGYFADHAVDRPIAENVGVRERNGALRYPYTPREGAAFVRTRPLSGSHPIQPKGVPLALWWPLGPPERAKVVLVCEGEADALAALSVRYSSNGDAGAREVLGRLNHVTAIPGTGYPVERLLDELLAVGTREAYLAFDADEPGDRYADEAAAALRAVGIRPLRVPLPEGTDLADCLAAADDRTWWLADALLTADAIAEEEAGREPEPDEPQPKPEQASPDRWATIDGAAFALDVPDQVPAVWGGGEEVAWAKDEPLGIVGPQGVGKTTITHLLLLALLGLRRDVLGLPVAEVDGGVLLLALDRPAQAARALRRVVGEDDREALRDRLAVWRGHLPFDLFTEPGGLARMAIDLGVGAVLLDAAKDTGLRLSTDEGGGAFNDALQALIEAHVQVAFDHHQRKPTSENRRPKALADVYGSMWVTAGCGSVLLLWGEPGDPVVELTHLKAPAGEIGPLTVVYDQRHGTATVDEGGHDRMIDVVRERGGSATVREAAIGFYGVSEPDRNAVERARRKLEALVAVGSLSRVDEETKFGPRATYEEVGE
jgi:hypothetical protein